jgi:hypothetical protein
VRRTDALHQRAGAVHALGDRTIKQTGYFVWLFCGAGFGIKSIWGGCCFDAVIASENAFAKLSKLLFILSGRVSTLLSSEDTRLSILVTWTPKNRTAPIITIAKISMIQRIASNGPPLVLGRLYRQSCLKRPSNGSPRPSRIRPAWSIPAIPLFLSTLSRARL